MPALTLLGVTFQFRAYIQEKFAGFRNINISLLSYAMKEWKAKKEKSYNKGVKVYFAKQTLFSKFSHRKFLDAA